jgi:hypothetical protein
VRTFLGLLFLIPCLVTGYWWQKDGLHWEGADHAMYAIAFLFFGLPCGLIAAWLLLRR